MFETCRYASCVLAVVGVAISTKSQDPEPVEQLFCFVDDVKDCELVNYSDCSLTIGPLINNAASVSCTNLSLPGGRTFRSVNLAFDGSETFDILNDEAYCGQVFECVPGYDDHSQEIRCWAANELPGVLVQESTAAGGACTSIVSLDAETGDGTPE